MTVEELETEIMSLKERVAELSKAWDYIEIWKLQSMYSHLYHMGKMSRIPSLFAQKTPGVTLEIEDSGVYEGIKSVERFWSTVFSDQKARSAGHLALHMTVNPIIEINKAGTMAKGVWHSHGYCAMGRSPAGPKQFLCLGKYDMEYIKEDDRWKILKFAYRQTFMSSYEKGWVEEPVAASIAGSPENMPDKPTTYYMPYSRYRINEMLPLPPEPYNE
jgi:hypothetical protein